MIELLAASGWGLFAFGAVTHTWHHRRLRELLAMHIDHERLPAAALTIIELVLAVAIPVAWFADSSLLPALATTACVVALAFVAWIGRLLLTGSDLPCACSFSAAPTSWWSFARSVWVALVGLFVMAESVEALSAATAAATLAVGAALAAAVFVAPEALSWPAASKALLARVDAYAGDAG